jgi:large subunit ribosomal protein L5
MNRLENHYKRLVERDLISKLAYQKTSTETLKFKKIHLHISLGSSSKNNTKDSKQLKAKVYKNLVGLEILTATKPRLHFCNKAVGEIQLRKGSLSGISVNLKGNQIFFFLDLLVNQVLPSLRPFENLKREGLDKKGNFSFRLKSMLSFPILQQNYQKFMTENEEESSLEISISASSENKEESLLLYSAFQLPFEGFSKTN